VPNGTNTISSKPEPSITRTDGSHIPLFFVANVGKEIATRETHREKAKKRHTDSEKERAKTDTKQKKIRRALNKTPKSFTSYKIKSKRAKTLPGNENYKEGWAAMNSV
jgi:hypothetical protein